MSSLNRRHGRVAGLVAVGALLVASAPLAQAQSGSGSTARLVNEVKAPSSVDAPALRAAAARSACKITGISPTKVVIGASTVNKKFSAEVSGCTLSTYAVAIDAFLDPTQVKPYDGISVTGDETAQLRPKYLTNADAGKIKKSAHAAAYGEEDDATADPAEGAFTFQILRRASFGSTFNASPEPVKKGKKLTIKGTLKRVSFDGHANPGYVGFAKAPVQIQFKATGASKFKTVKTVKTTKGGKISTTIKASKSGTWQLYFAGYSTTSNATSGTDGVKVK